MQFALEDAYKSFVKSERFPGCVLFLELDPGKVDVNVHPAKLEVRFAEEKAVYQGVYAAVRKTLQSLSNRLAKDEYEAALKEFAAGNIKELPKISETKKPPTVSYEVKTGSFRENAKELPLFSPAPSRGKSLFVSEEEKISANSVAVNRADFMDRAEKTPVAQKAPEKKEFFSSQKEPEVPQFSVPEPIPEAEKFVPNSEPIAVQLSINESKKTAEDNPIAQEGVIRGVIFHAFILYETKTHLYLIDKHAAHERILYEALKKNHGERSVQMLLEPLLISFSPAESAILSEFQEELEKAGFVLEEFGDNAFLLRGIPLEFTALSGDDLKGILEESAKELSLGGRAGGAGEKRFDRTLYSMACKAAIKAGIPSTEADHQWIVDQIKSIDNITVCPHGRPILVPFTKKQIENLFLRT